MVKDNGKVNIHGKEYETVASRVQRFREAHKLDLSIVTEIVDRNESTVVMKASIFKGDLPIATGYAEENRTSSTINRTSALENCETSAIGRALAAFGMAGTEYASADEVAHAISQQYPDKKATDKQKALIAKKLEEIGVAAEDMKGYLIEQFGITNTANMTAKDASMVIESLIS